MKPDPAAEPMKCPMLLGETSLGEAAISGEVAGRDIAEGESAKWYEERNGKGEILLGKMSWRDSMKDNAGETSQREISQREMSWIKLAETM